MSSFFLNILPAQEALATSLAENTLDITQEQIALKKIKTPFNGKFSPINIAQNIKKQLTSPELTQFVKYYGAYTTYSVFMSIINVLIHELGHALIAQKLGYHSELCIGFPIKKFLEKPSNNSNNYLNNSIYLNKDIDESTLVMHPLPEEPLKIFFLGNLKVNLFPILFGGYARIEPRIVTNKPNLFVMLAGGPLAGATYAYLVMTTIEIFNQISLNNSFKKSILQGLKSPITVGKFIIDYYKQWVVSLKNKPSFKTLINPDNPPFLKLMLASALYGICSNLSQLIPFDIEIAKSDGYHMAQLAFNTKITPQLGQILNYLASFSQHAPMYIGIAKGIFENSIGQKN